MWRFIATTGTFLIFLVGMIHEHYSQDRELHYLHHLPKGTLQSNVNYSCVEPLTCSSSQKQFMLQVGGKKIFKSSGESFILLLKSKGESQGNGDSFYRVTDEQISVCSSQVLQSIKYEQGYLRIRGFFSDCPDSNYYLSIKQKESQIEFFVGSTDSYNRIYVKFYDESSIQYFGLGEQFSNLNLGRDKPYSMMVREKGVARGDFPETAIINYLHGVSGSYFTSYCPAPIWISSQKVGYVLNSSAYSAWINNQLLVWDSDANMIIYVESSFKKIVAKIAEFNGYTPPVPDWVNQGIIVGLQGGDKAVLQKYKKIRKAGTNVTGVWMQDWVGKRRSLGYCRLWWNWQLDQDYYSEWTSLQDQLKKDGSRVLIYINPMLSDASSKQNRGENFYQQAKERNYFIKDKGGQVFHTSSVSDFRAAMFDFYNEEGKKFFQSIIRKAIMETNASGMMVDFSEAYPISESPFSIEDAIKIHNQYPKLYLSAVQEVFQEFPQQQIYSFSRAGHLGTPKHTQSLWAGDQNMNFKKNAGLPSCLTAMLSSALVGYSNTHCDVGGYVYFEAPFLKESVRSKILMIRWMQLGAFSPVFRTHEGNAPDKVIHAYDDDLVEELAFYSQIFSVLAQYRKEAAIRSADEKIPLIRPLFLENQTPAEVFKVTDQYYLGSDILVCPILSSKNSRKYYLPKGQWINIWNADSIEGCDCYQHSDSFLPPVFIKAQSAYRQTILEGIRNIRKQFKQVERAENEQSL